MKFEEKLNEVKGKLYINGVFVDSDDGKLFDVINPATETVICESMAASVKDV